MEGPEITFLFQFGNLRDTVSVVVSALNLRSLKDMACDFINDKVSRISFSLVANKKPQTKCKTYKKKTDSKSKSIESFFWLVGCFDFLLTVSVFLNTA